jgi:hypothetical protein
MSSVFFETPRPHPSVLHDVFPRPLCLLSQRSGRPQLSPDELLAFVSHLESCICVRFRPSRQRPYSLQTFVSCCYCLSNRASFSINADPRSMTFLVEMIEYCPRQPWQHHTKEGCEVVRHVSIPLVANRPIWPCFHPFRVIGKGVGRYLLFPRHFRTKFESQWYSKA